MCPHPPPPACPSLPPCRERGALPKRVRGGRRSQSPSAAALANWSQQRGCEQSPALHPRHTSAPRQQPGTRVLTPAVTNCPPGLRRRARQRDPCPAHCTTPARPRRSGQGAAGPAPQQRKDQGVDDDAVPKPSSGLRLSTLGCSWAPAPHSPAEHPELTPILSRATPAPQSPVPSCSQPAA